MEMRGIVALAAIVWWLVERQRRTAAELRNARARIYELETRERRASRVETAYRHLDAITPDAAVLIVNAQGIITEWTAGAARLYGYTAPEAVGASASMLMSGGSAVDLLEAIGQAAAGGSARGGVVHCRQDGTRFNVDVEITPASATDHQAFIVTVRDLTRQREWDAFSASASRAQRTLRAEADEALRQLAALEQITDPSLNNPDDPEMLRELLERLRSSVDADGVALAATAARGRLVTAQGIKPKAIAARLHDGRRPPNGRVVFVQNDPDRVAQVSLLVWPDTVTSLVVVPVVSGGKVHAVMEIANERPRRATDWDIALARTAADKLATLIAGAEYGRAGAVA